jgi:thiamine biosynthesis protein ThiI
MREVLLLRYGEVHLKGLNRPVFLRALTNNARAALKGIAGSVWLSDSRIYAADIADMRAALDRARKVFGVHSASPAFEMRKDYSEIADKCLELTRPLSGSFKVEARRSDKRYPMTSMDLERELGRAILTSNPRLRVDVHKPEHRVSVEIREMAYVYIGEYPAAGGLPSGTGGRAMLLLSGGIDSPVAGYSLMRRGVVVSAIHFFSFPYTGERAKEKVLSLARLLGEYQNGMKVILVPFTDIQTRIRDNCPDELGTIIARRFMMRISCAIARRERAQALITGDSLGQVASQTMEALGATDAVADMPVFRPLIGLDKLEITQAAIKIGTYETSILPYDDCCAVFTPRRPAIRPRLARVTEAEAILDAGALIEAAVLGAYSNSP